MLMHRHSNCGPSNNGELSGSGSSKTLTLHENEVEHTPTKDKHLIKMKREHKVGCVIQSSESTRDGFRRIKSTSMNLKVSLKSSEVGFRLLNDVKINYSMVLFLI